jgi:hypothetical protein
VAETKTEEPQPSEEKVTEETSAESSETAADEPEETPQAEQQTNAPKVGAKKSKNQRKKKR